MRRRLHNKGAAARLALAACLAGAAWPAARAQTQTAAAPAAHRPDRATGLSAADESSWSDKFTGGHIERTELEENNPNIEITVDIPAFRLTLWQDGKEVKTYRIGVGQKEYPLAIGEREALEVIWNPAWIPPDSDWVSGHKGVRPGEVISARDPRNPLGKVKIPFGGGYLIHQAQGPRDLGNLVSHGCVRMLLADLYDLAEKIVVAYGRPVSAQQIARAERSQRTLTAALATPLSIDVNYDTLIVEGGELRLYPDVYDRGTNTVARLRAELDSSGVDTTHLTDRTLRQLLARVGRYTVYAVSVESIKAGRALADGEVRPLISPPAHQKPARTPRTARRPAA